jgi:hypothetical protein
LMILLEISGREIYGKAKRKGTRFQLQIETECHPSKAERLY